MNNIFKIYYADIKKINKVIVFKGSLEISINNVFDKKFLHRKK